MHPILWKIEYWIEFQKPSSVLVSSQWQSTTIIVIKSKAIFAIINLAFSSCKIAEFGVIGIHKKFRNYQCTQKRWLFGGIYGLVASSVHSWSKKHAEAIVTINGVRCRAMINQFMFLKIDDIDADNIRFERNGATCQTANETINLLQKFGESIISRNGPVH